MHEGDQNSIIHLGTLNNVIFNVVSTQLVLRKQSTTIYQPFGGAPIALGIILSCVDI